MRITRRQRRWVVGSVVGLAFTALSATGAAAQQASAADVAAGARVYGHVCGRCHNSRSPLERTDRQWVVIANHMRVRANLTGKEARSVVAFLQSTNSDPRQAVVTEGATPVETEETAIGGPVATDAESIAEGRGLIDQKACLGCHVIGNAGGAVGPGLNGVVGNKGAAFVRRKLANPTFDNATSMMPNFGLTSEQIEAMLAYLASLENR